MLKKLIYKLNFEVTNVVLALDPGKNYVNETGSIQLVTRIIYYPI